MKALSAQELLDVWENGLDQRPIQKALTLLIAAYPETSPESLARLSIGQRDSLLLDLRERIFGQQLIGISICQSCGEKVELAFSTNEIRVANEVEALEESTISSDGYEVHFRLPNSYDLVDLDATDELLKSRDKLLERAILSANFGAEKKPFEDLPESVKDEVVRQMEVLDPQADIQMAISCPSCGNQWEAVLDIVSFFWSEINAWACRILREVHTLALAYGWQESEILAMSPIRRQIYLEMAGV
jgi:uncharacterized protein (UPF0212 family)